MHVKDARVHVGTWGSARIREFAIPVELSSIIARAPPKPFPIGKHKRPPAPGNPASDRGVARWRVQAAWRHTAGLPPPLVGSARPLFSLSLFPLSFPSLARPRVIARRASRIARVARRASSLIGPRRTSCACSRRRSRRAGSTACRPRSSRARAPREGRSG